MTPVNIKVMWNFETFTLKFYNRTVKFSQKPLNSLKSLFNEPRIQFPKEMKPRYYNIHNIVSKVN